MKVAITSDTSITKVASSYPATFDLGSASYKLVSENGTNTSALAAYGYDLQWRVLKAETTVSLKQPLNSFDICAIACSSL